MEEFKGNYDHVPFGDLPLNAYFFRMYDGKLRKCMKTHVDGAVTVDTGLKVTMILNLYDEVWIEKDTKYKLNY